MKVLATANWWQRIEHRLVVSVEWPDRRAVADLVDGAVVDASPHDGRFAKTLEHRLGRLVGDLLPGHVEVDLRLRAGDRPRVRVDDVPLRVPVAVPDDAGDGRSAVSWIEQAVFADREALVTPSYAAQLFSALAQDGVALPGHLANAGALQGAVGELLTRGLRVEPGFERLLAAAGSPDADFEAAKEAALDGLYPRTLRVELSRRQYDLVLGPGDDPASGAAGERMTERVAAMRDGLFYELGVRVPAIEFAVRADLEDDEFRLFVNDLGAPPVRGRDGNGAPADHLVAVLEGTLRDHAAALLNQSRVEYALGTLAELLPAVVTHAVARFPLHQLTAVFRELLAEGIHIRDLRMLLETVLASRTAAPVDGGRYIVFFPPESGAVPVEPERVDGALRTSDLVMRLRMAMRSYISHKYTRGSGLLSVLLIAPELEARLGDPAARALTEAEHEALIEAIAEETRDLDALPSPPVILTTDHVRPKLRRLIERELPRLPVVGYWELDPSLNIRPLARVDWEG